MPRYYKPRCNEAKKKFKGLDINNPDDNLITDRLTKTRLILLDAIKNSYDDVLQQHFTLRLPDDYSGAYTIEELYGRFSVQLDNLWRKKGNRRKLHYISCIEIEKAKNEHIHFMTFVDSHSNRASGVKLIIQQAWEYALTSQQVIDDVLVEVNEYNSGLAHYSRGSMRSGLEKIALSIPKDDDAALNEAMYWASYLCKHRAGTPLFRFRSSQLKK